MDDYISRQQAIDALNEYFVRIGKLKRRGLNKGEKAISLDTVGAINSLPPAHPEQNLDEWCADCKEYDHENSCCPRWTKVIRQTRRELQDEFVMTAVDGTLWVTVDDVQKVGRVIVDEDKSKFCRQFYMDAQPEPCEDAVSRKDCLQALSHLMDVEGFRDGWAVSRANVECMLKSMPPVTPKQRTGKWIKITNTLYKCDQCGAVQLKGNYCKDCEAKMEGANNESD